MFKWMLSGLFGLGVAIAIGQLSQSGAGASGSCVCNPVSAPTGGVYDSATLSGSTGNGGAFTGSNAVSPACTTTAGTLVEDTSTGQHQVIVSGGEIIHTFSGTPVTMIVYVQQGSGTRNFQLATVSSSFGSTSNVTINPSTGAIVAAATTTYAGASVSANVFGPFSSPTSGTYFVVVMTTSTVTDSGIYMALNSSNGTSTSYPGDGASNLKYWGAGVSSP